MTTSVEIRGSGSCWSVLHNGEQLGNVHNAYEKACISAGVWERRLRTHTRKCLCCAAEFKSEGRGHRMCDTCREAARQAMV